jgi:hypothetical protein
MLDFSGYQRRSAMKYRIYSSESGDDLGVYEAESEAHALDVMAQESGYASHDEASAVSGDDGSDLVVELVEDDD